jgi:hypothetical protein
MALASSSSSGSGSDSDSDSDSEPIMPSKVNLLLDGCGLMFGVPVSGSGLNAFTTTATGIDQCECMARTWHWQVDRCRLANMQHDKLSQ